MRECTKGLEDCPVGLGDRGFGWYEGMMACGWGCNAESARATARRRGMTGQANGDSSFIQLSFQSRQLEYCTWGGAMARKIGHACHVTGSTYC